MSRPIPEISIYGEGRSYSIRQDDKLIVGGLTYAQAKAIHKLCASVLRRMEEMQEKMKWEIERLGMKGGHCE